MYIQQRNLYKNSLPDDGKKILPVFKYWNEEQQQQQP